MIRLANAQFDPWQGRPAGRAGESQPPAGEGDALGEPDLPVTAVGVGAGASGDFDGDLAVGDPRHTEADVAASGLLPRAEEHIPVVDGS